MRWPLKWHWSVAIACGAAIGAPASTDSAAAFEAIVPVLHSPRCMNCHMPGNFPRMGDQSIPHRMDVGGGPDGKGVGVVKCNSCHQEKNAMGLHAPPGAPDWRLPPPQTRVVWEGLSDSQLCALFKDPARNGHKTVAQIVQHMETPLVTWGWHPGEGRAPVPLAHDTFLADVKAWAAGGAGCPAEH